MHVALLILPLPLALNGEATGGGESIGLGIISVVSIVIGYVVLAALWYFVFRDKSRARRKKDPPS